MTHLEKAKAAVAKSQEVDAAAADLLARVEETLRKAAYEDYVEANIDTFHTLYAADPLERTPEQFQEDGYQQWLRSH